MATNDPIPTFSFLIVNYRSAAYLPACFSSLRNITLSASYECIVANNDASEDAALRALQARFSFTLVSLSENRGFGSAINRAAEHARGNILVLLNPDARFLSGDINSVARRFERDRALGIVGFSLLLELETPQPWSVGREITLLDILRNKKGFPRSAPLGKTEMPRVVSWVSGAALAVSRELFFRIHGFDERFFLYYEDADFCNRMKRFGKKTLFLPNMRVLHKGGASMDTARREQKNSYFTSQDIYFSLYRPRYERILLKFLRGMALL